MVSDNVVRLDFGGWISGPCLDPDEIPIPPVEDLAADIVTRVHQVLSAYRSDDITEETALARLRKVAER